VTTGESKFRAPRRAAVIFIFVTVALDGIAGGMALPILPALVGKLTGGGGAEIAAIFGVFGTVFYLTQLFSAPVQGALSDRFGRRPVVLGSNFGMAANYVLFALAPAVPWLFLAQGISGAASGSQSTAFAYMTDVTPPEQRTRMFAILGVASSIGFVAGPALSGIAATIDLRAPFWLAAGLCLVNGLYGLLVLPESLQHEHRAGLSWKSANPLGVVGSLSRAYPILIGWALVILVSQFGMTGINAIYTVYLSYRYDWQPGNLAIYMSVFGVWSMVAQGLVLPQVSKRLGDRRCIIVGGLIAALGITAMGLAPRGILYASFAFFWMFFLVLNGAAVNSMISRVVGPSEQGRLQGALRSLTSLVGILAPGLFAFLLSEGIKFGGKPFAGLPFWLCGLLTLGGTLVAIWITRATAAGRERIGQTVATEETMLEQADAGRLQDP
jgi:DHA1 family tetracycline resistance protein-like MFS transporter